MAHTSTLKPQLRQGVHLCGSLWQWLGVTRGRDPPVPLRSYPFEIMLFFLYVFDMYSQCHGKQHCAKKQSGKVFCVREVQCHSCEWLKSGSENAGISMY